MRDLVNEDGKPFDPPELGEIRKRLDRFNTAERKAYRGKTTLTVAQHPHARILIVSGPGTGKSYLFLKRIDHWFSADPFASVLMTSFVRKLVADLQTDINNDEHLSDEQKGQTTVSTLHRFARSIVEINNGTEEWKFRPHFKIIGQSWKKVVWEDVLAHDTRLHERTYPWSKFEEQLHNDSYEQTDEWNRLKDAYYALCVYYNAAGFADLIVRARIALDENPGLNESSYFIIDEYQDFNSAEETLIKALVKNSEGLLIVGDDEQVLYEKLKSGKASLIRGLYADMDFANAMLPFCGRSTYHITKTADHFIEQHRDEDCIEKIYLPLDADTDTPKVQVVACAAPSTAVDYIERFVSENEEEIEERKTALLDGNETKDPFLLILTPANELRFYKPGNADKKLHEMVAKYQAALRRFEEDYFKLLTYYSLAKNPHNNFTFRKVLFYEEFSTSAVHRMISTGMRDGHDLCDIDDEGVRAILEKSGDIRDILESDDTVDEKIDILSLFIGIADPVRLKEDIQRVDINDEQIEILVHEEEEEAEQEEIEVRTMGAVELLSIVGSKGLSADHVIIIGFDDVNFGWITKNAFYVAMTRARKSLHIITALKSGGSQKAHDFLDQLPDAHIEFYSYKKSGHEKMFLRDRRAFVDYFNRLKWLMQKRA